MRILLKTKVGLEHREVFAQFNTDLLKALTPPGVKLEFIEVDEPDFVGAKIHMRVTLLGIFKQEWKNFVTEREVGTDSAFFVDEGKELPGVLKYWRHKHLIRASGAHTEIVDDIEYKGKFGFLSVLMYPFLWAQFAYRKPIYRRLFGKV